MRVPVQMARCPAATHDNAAALADEVLVPLLHDPAASVRDNACGALARALMAHRGSLPEERLLQVCLAPSGSTPPPRGRRGGAHPLLPPAS